MTQPAFPSLNTTGVEQSTLQDTAIEAIGMVGPFVALLTAAVATAGSLFLSEVLGWVPCTLCWYQRILMYPLCLVLLVGIIRRDRKLYQYVLPFSLWGACVSTYHYLLQKTDWLPPPTCTSAVPCSVDYINLLGFVTVPFLALLAFLIISASSLAAMLVEDEMVDAPVQRLPFHHVGWDRTAALAIVALVLIAYRIAVSLIL